MLDFERSENVNVKWYEKSGGSRGGICILESRMPSNTLPLRPSTRFETMKCIPTHPPTWSSRPRRKQTHIDDTGEFEAEYHY